MWHLVGRRGLVVTDSVVTRRLGHVKGITMNLETVRFPGEKLLHREELECREDCVQGLRQCSLLYFFVIFKPLRYTCRRKQRVLKRRLVQPRYSVSHLRITQVQQRRSGRSLCLSRVDFKRSLLRSHSLSEDLVSSCWDLLTVTVIVLVIRKKTLLISGSMATVKLTGNPSRVGNSTDEDLETGELDLESRDSLQLLALLTGVLTRLSGVLVDLCGVLRNLSGVLGLLSGVIAEVADLLGVESCLVSGADDWAGGQAGSTGTLDWSILRCSNVHKDKVYQRCLIDGSRNGREKRTAGPCRHGDVWSTPWRGCCRGSMSCRSVQPDRWKACWILCRVIKL